MKKGLGIFILTGVMMVALSGCEKTPEEAIITEKNKDNMSNYETSKDTGTPIRETINAPEHYTNVLKLQDGALTINTDAEVVVPEVSSLDTIKVTAMEPDQDFIDTVTNTFFKGGTYYNGFKYNTPEKSSLEEDLAYLKKCKAEGNNDPYDYGTNPEGILKYDIDMEISSLEEEIKTAPEGGTIEKAKPSFGLSTFTKDDDEYAKNDMEIVVELGDDTYDYSIQRNGEGSWRNSVNISRDQGYSNYDESDRYWNEARYNLEGHSAYDFTTTKEDLKKKTKISYEDAKALADEKIESLGIDNMTNYSWDYALYSVDVANMTEDSIKNYGYIFKYCRNIKGCPITYTTETGGCLDVGDLESFSAADIENATPPWGCEVCNIIISDKGVEELAISDLYDIGEVQNKNVKLMDFDEIIKIYEQMMEVSNANISETENFRNYNITRIELGYARIYDPKADNSSGVLVPVWDFFGGYDVDSKNGYTVRDDGKDSRNTCMTINAVDGTIIDRAFGY